MCCAHLGLEMGTKRKTKLYRVRRNSMPKLLEVRGGTETKMYCQATVCRTCVLAVPLTIKVGLTKVGNQEKH
jgi:hypothetical protein